MREMQGILNREMDRKEFLIYLGGVLITVIGVSNLLQSIGKATKSERMSSNGAFGYGPYGGFQK